MEPLGDRLRKARESLGLSIEDVHNATKIRVAYLVAMEEGRFSELPGEVYVRGFLKSVGKAVGIDGDELVIEYDRIRKDSKTEEPKANSREKEDTHKRRKAARVVCFAAIGLLLVAFLFASMFLGKPENGFDANTVDTLAPQNDSCDIQEMTYGNNEQHETGEDAKENSTGASDTGQVNDSEEGHELMAVITERCWVRVISDGHKVFERTMLPGDEEIWKAKEEIRIRLGNAGGVDLTYNGFHMGPPGKSGDVIELSFPVPGM